MIIQRVLSFAIVAGAALVLSGCPDAPDPGPGAANRYFDSQYLITTGSNAANIVPADFNGDGILDLATVNSGPDQLVVMLGNAVGPYTVNTTAIGPNAVSLAAADFNGDGRADLVTTTLVSDTARQIEYLQNNGNGTFAASIALALADNAVPIAVAAGNVYGNANADIVAAIPADGTVAVLAGDGAGGFEELAARLDSGGDGTREVVIAEVTGNAQPDIITVNRDSNDISVLPGAGGGTFGAPVIYGVGNDPRDVAAVDVNGDTILDLVVSNPGSGDLSVLTGAGAGIYLAEQRVDVANLPTRLTTADFNRDNRGDIAVTLVRQGGTDSLSSFAVLLGGNGGLTAPRYWGARSTRELVAGDFDNDDRPDVATANNLNASLIFGRGNGTFETDERFSVGARPRTIVVQDMNNDSRLDLVVSNLETEDLSVLLGNGNGTFQQEITTNVSGTPRALAVARINNDLFYDVVATDLDDSQISVFLGQGNGSFQPERRFSVADVAEGGGSREPRSVALGDLNGDGKLDVVTANAQTDSISVLLGDGTGQFGAAKESFADVLPLAVNLIDMNKDSKLDYVVTNGNEKRPRVNVAFGKGDGTFTEDTRVSYGTGPVPQDMVVGDFNNDGNIDAITMHNERDQIYILQGRTGGALTGGVSRTSGLSPNSLAAQDFNDDRQLDLLVTQDGDTVSVLINKGEISFNVPQLHYVGDSPIGGVLADLNGDRRLDCIVANRNSDDVSVLMGSN